MTASVKVILYKSKTLSNGEHPVMLCVYKEGKRKYISLGISSKAEQWNSKDGLPKKKHPLYTELVAIINKAKTDVSKEVLTLTVENQEYKLNQLKSMTRKTEATPTQSVLAYFRLIETRLVENGRIGYANVFRSTHNSLQAFCGTCSDFDFSDVDTSFLIRYEEWFLKRALKLNSIFVFMRTFKTLINYARKESVVKSSYDPFKDFGFSKFRRIKTVKRALSKEQIQSIAAYACKADSYLFHARNYFMFSYYTRGINFIDIAHLRWSDVNDGRLVYIRRKTKERFDIKLLKPAFAIIHYYRPDQSPGNDDYIFPILEKGVHVSPRQVDDRLDKVSKRVNNALKTIGKSLGLRDKLTTYVARHSFATVLKRSGTPITVISELMGHDSEQTTMIYLADFENEVLDKAAEAVL